MGGYAPYGYVLHPEIRNKLKLDPEAAKVVRRVFDEALDGRNTSQIALGLNDDNIPTPGQYFKGKHPDKKKFSRMSDKISWTASMVYKIIVNYVYTGATVGHSANPVVSAHERASLRIRKTGLLLRECTKPLSARMSLSWLRLLSGAARRIPKRNLRYYPLKGLVCCGTANAPLPGESSEMRADISISVPTQRMTAIRIARLVKDTARHGLRTLLTKRLGKCSHWSKRELSKNMRSASAGNLPSQNARTQSVICKSSLNSSKQSNSGCMRNILPAVSQKAEYLKRKAETDAKMSENEEAIQQGHQRMQELDSEHPCSDERA